MTHFVYEHSYVLSHISSRHRHDISHRGQALTCEQYDTSVHLLQGILAGLGQRFVQGKASSGGNGSGISVFSIALPWASQSDAANKPRGSFNLRKAVNIRSAEENGLLESAMGTVSNGCGMSK